MIRRFPRPLPRALAPLPDETLVGHILRLSYRLDAAPIHIARWAGLAQSGDDALEEGAWGTSIPVSPLIRMTPQQSRRFALACRLSPKETRLLSLGSLADRYPPVSPNPVHTGGKTRSPKDIASGDSWVATRFTRYCPQCLASNSSQVQDRYGGSWRKQWRLAVLFACTRHRRLLHSTCPACSTPAQGTEPSYISTLITNPHGEPRHPAACRSMWWMLQDPCEARLDDPEIGPIPMTPQALQRLLALQEHLNDLLEGKATRAISFGRRVWAKTYFADLRVVSCIIQSAHPRSLHILCDPDIHAAYVDYRSSEEREDDSRYILQRNPTTQRTHEKPPLRAKPLGCLLALATEFLDASPTAVSDHIAEMLATSSFNVAEVRHMATTPRLSAALRHLLTARSVLECVRPT